MCNKCRQCINDTASAEDHNRYCENCIHDKQLVDNFKQRPREVWVTFDSIGLLNGTYGSKDHALRYAVENEIVLMREVIKND